jgi:hypothetical protein
VPHLGQAGGLIAPEPAFAGWDRFMKAPAPAEFSKHIMGRACRLALRLRPFWVAVMGGVFRIVGFADRSVYYLARARCSERQRVREILRAPFAELPEGEPQCSNPTFPTQLVSQHLRGQRRTSPVVQNLARDYLLARVKAAGVVVP